MSIWLAARRIMRPLGFATLLLFLATALALHAPTAGSVTSSIIVVGRGPERAFIERAAHAFERAHVGTAVDIRWGHTLNLADLVKSGEATLAVSDHAVPDLTATPIGWEGLAIIVHFANPVADLTAIQLRDLFTGTIRGWGELHERGAGGIEVIRRPEDRHLNHGLETSLGIPTGALVDARPIRSDQAVLSSVAGRLGAVSYVSLATAMEAVTYGSPVRILLVNGIEPAPPTVATGQYVLRRPIMLLSREVSPLLRTFFEFLASPEGQRILAEFYVPSR